MNDAFNGVAANMNVDGAKLTQMLDGGGASAATLKQSCARKWSGAVSVRGRFKASLEIRRQRRRGADAAARSDSATNQVGYEYILRPVLLVVPRGSPDAAFDARKKEAEALRARFSDCTIRRFIRPRLRRSRCAIQSANRRRTSPKNCATFSTRPISAI